MKFYHFMILLTILMLYGCNSKSKTEEKKHIPDRQITQPSKSIKQIPKISDNKAILFIDKNTSIEISKTDIKTTLCKTDDTIILHIFAPWMKTSIAQIKSLDKLKSQINQDICILSIAIDSDSNTSITKEYKSNHKILFDLQNNNFIDKISQIIKVDKNFKLPMNIIYKNHKYFNNYQGIMPLEILKHIIKG